MKTIHYITGLLTIAASTLLVSCGVDDYAVPDAALSGTVKDAITGNPLITEQPNGFQVRNEELSWSDNPRQEHFWGKADGTYKNTKMFPGHYRISLVNGPFVPPAPQEVDLKSGQTATLDFTVTPYVTITDFNVVKSGSDEVTVTFKVSKNAGTIKDYRIFATDQTPLVGINYFDSKYSNIKIGDDEIAAISLTDADLGQTITATRNNYKSGKYWIRVGVCCNESGGRYNLTEVKEIAF
ncbi:MAG: DUF3823 domain-containing protein [Bacteroidales bacterium]|jgi:hypothetical protein|nr:DUF3823 domain-containing protein [Bacteroidales bacterium]